MIGPVGSAVFVNQMTVNATALQNAHNNRIDFQNMIAQAAAQEKERKVLEVRPAEENHEVDEDPKEHNERERRKGDRRKEKDKEEEDPITDYKLDIKV